jgi:LmbE family N-acetylglucosaminyl deacetylase
MRLDILAIAAHPDDVELTCGGAVIKMVEAGYKVGIVDLTVGESGTRGSVALRKKESDRASLVMGIVHRENLGLPDAGVEDRRDYKLKIAQRIRALQPRTVILPYWEGRHPDHYIAGQIGYEACFLAGLAKLPLEGVPHRPHKIKAVLCYASQFSPRQDWRNLFPSRVDCRERLAAQARHFGDMIGVRYGEPFVTREIAAVDDLVHMPVRSI